MGLLWSISNLGDASSTNRPMLALLENPKKGNKHRNLLHYLGW